MTIAHSLWQIALIWLVFKALEACLRRRHQAVYLLSLLSMLGATLWSGFTFATEWARLKPAEDVFFATPEAVNLAPDSPLSFESGAGLSLWESAQRWLEAHSAPIGWAWLAIAGVLWLRLLGGWYLAQQLRRRDVSPMAEALQQQCTNWAKRLNISAKVQMLESAHISEPLTLGFWKPVVLFPVGLALQLSPAQVETLLLHELAHIRRHDYLINLFQLGLEVCFFYHPLFWMLSREARSRREFCCDAVVMQHTSDPILYAKTLTDLQLSFLQPSTQFVMNATGKSRFSERILHIVGISPKRSARPNFLIVMLLPLAIGLSSWWPSAPGSEPQENTMDLPNIPVLDTTPPRHAAMDKQVVRAQTPAPPAAKIADSPVPKADAPPVPRENVALEVVKMNVFYVGVDNPIRIAAGGIPPAELTAELIGDGKISGSNGNFIVQVRQPGEVKIRIMHKNELVAEQTYRVKRIPDPTPKMDGKYRSGPISVETMLQAKGILSVLENFDFDAVCEVVSYEVTYLPKEQEPISWSNTGGQMNKWVLDAAKNAKPGDAFFFDDIKVTCPGDAAPRNVGGAVFKIK